MRTVKLKEGNERNIGDDEVSSYPNEDRIDLCALGNGAYCFNPHAVHINATEEQDLRNEIFIFDPSGASHCFQH
jgi:hypothetical protein